MSSKHSSSKDVINGFFAGTFSAFITQPLQVTRTSMMVTYINDKPSGFIQIIKRIYKEEGLKGFYRGFLPSLLKSPIGSAIYYSSLERNKRFLKKSNYFGEKSTNFISSALARISQCILLNPLLVVITRFEVVGFNSYTSLIDAFIKIKKEEGFRGYFLGLKPLLIKEIPTSAMFYMLYEIFKNFWRNSGFTNTQFIAASSAMMSNVIITVLNNPLDVIRTRLQYLHFSKNENHKYKGVISGIVHIAKHEGAKGLLVGMLPRVIKRATAGSVTWTIYETLKEKNAEH
jgi:hypothetical protein